METQEIERLIKISKEKPLLPEVFVPWQNELQAEEIYLPERLNSLAGLPIYETLTPQQKLELGRHEVVQVMFSYGWSEGLFCLFMNRYIIGLPSDNIEYRFLVRELIEEFRHQDMFSAAVMKLEGKPIKPSAQHFFWGKLTVKFLPASWVFMSGLSVEMIADVYGKFMRKSPEVYSVLRKVSELHHIEEGRHIYFTQKMLERYTKNAGFIKRTWYSLLVLLNIYYMRTLYVKKEIYERIGMENPALAYKQGYKNFRQKFAKECLGTAIEFTRDFNGFNFITRPLWRWLLNADV